MPVRFWPVAPKFNRRTKIDNPNLYGIYRVGNNSYFSKIEAVYKANTEKLPIKFDFHDDVYSKFDWSKRPAGTIRDHYKDRAQQIRDTYDHVIIPFSGGMDSWTVLHSFLSNNIKVDEIWTNWPFKQISYQSVNNLNKNEFNILSEFKYAVLPVLTELKKTHPEINIVINDYSDEFNGEFNESLIKLTNAWQGLSAPFRNHCRSDLCDLALSKNKKVARVYGFDKTKIRVVNNSLYAFFTDHHGTGEITTGETAEFFYHTPKAPLIPIIQAHYLKDELLRTKISQLTANPDPRSNIGSRGSLLSSLYIDACYPDYPRDTFQTGKPWGTLIRASDTWIEQYNPTFYQSWKWTYDQYFQNLDDTLISKSPAGITVGLKHYTSRAYLIDDNFICPDFDFNLNSVRT